MLTINSYVDDGDGNEATLMRHHAGWRKTCCIKFNQSLIEQLQKRTKENISSPLCMFKLSLYRSYRMTCAIFVIDQLGWRSSQCIYVILMVKFLDVQLSLKITS